MLAFDQRRAQTELAGANGGNVSTRSAADDDQIVRRIAHLFPPYQRIRIGARHAPDLRGEDAGG
jgi:hypothetical protein